MQEVIKSILKGVHVVPKCGYPGSLVVFDQNAIPILTGETTNSVIFAAAKYGQGRIFVTSHEAYIHHFLNNSRDFSNLWGNIKTWLLEETSVPVEDKNIPNIENFELVADIPQDVKLLKWIGTTNKTELFIHQLLKKYVMNGGNVICGICPWGWLSISHGRTLNDLSLNKFTSACGISFSASICLNSKSFFKVLDNLAHRSHFGNAVLNLNSDINSASNYKDLIISGIDSLQYEAAVKYLDKLNKILMSYVPIVYKPLFSSIVNSTTGTALMSISAKVYQKFAECSIVAKAPSIMEFPGDFLDTPNKVTATVEIRSKFNEFHCTGYYIEAGTSVKVAVLEGSPTGWEIRISSHTDDLSSMPVLKRWPAVFSSIKLKKQINITSAFGGIIYLDSPNGNSTLKLKLEDVVETPFLDLNQPETIKNWKKNAHSPGIWAEICGKHIVFTVPSYSVRNIPESELIESLNLWDLIVIANHELRGTDVNNNSRERVVADIQPFGDRMHSGYPIVMPYSYILPKSELFIFNPSKIRTNGWTLIHEICHNMTRVCWTPTGTEEVTVNIFTLHAFHLVFKQKPLTSHILQEKLNEVTLESHALKDFSFNEWSKNPYIGLLIYTQLINSFGWNAFKIIFREYESLNEKEQLLSNDLTKWDEWITRFSNIVGLDVSPLFYFWNIPFSERTSANLNDLTPWLPNDEISKFFPKRVNYVKKNYNGLLFGNESLYSSCPNIMYPDDFIFDSIEKLDSLNPRKISCED